MKIEKMAKRMLKKECKGLTDSCICGKPIEQQGETFCDKCINHAMLKCRNKEILKKNSSKSKRIKGEFK